MRPFRRALSYLTVACTPAIGTPVLSAVAAEPHSSLRDFAAMADSVADGKSPTDVVAGHVHAFGRRHQVGQGGHA